MRFRVGINSAVAPPWLPPSPQHAQNLNLPRSRFQTPFSPFKTISRLIHEVVVNLGNCSFWEMIFAKTACWLLLPVQSPWFPLSNAFLPFKTISRLIHGLCWTWATKFISKNIFARTPFLSPPVPAFKRLFCSSKPFCDLYTSLSAEPWQQNSGGEMIRAIKQHSDCCLLKNDTPPHGCRF